MNVRTQRACSFTSCTNSRVACSRASREHVLVEYEYAMLQSNMPARSTWTCHTDHRRAWHTGRGGILLEVMLALSILVMGAITILGALSQSLRSVEAVRLNQQAADLSRSAMAKLEAGIATVETLEGPVPTWETDPDSGADEMNDDLPVGEFGSSAAFAMGEDSDWELEIETSDSPFVGLTAVSIRAFRRASFDSDQILAQYTLHQLVRLDELAADTAGEEDEMMDAARRGIERERRSGSRGRSNSDPSGGGGL
jgi:hypothetical protein